MTHSGSPAPLSAACFCGAARLVTRMPPKHMVHCHCGQCRRLGGAAFTTWVALGRQAIEPTGDETLTAFAATPNVVRHFCKVCGSHVHTLDRRFPDVLGVPAGALEADVELHPDRHFSVDHRATWHAIADGLPRFGGRSGVEPVAAPAAVATLATASSRQLRLARPVSDLARAVEMYRRGLGLVVSSRFDDHAGYDGVMLGTATSPCHFEFTRCRIHPVAPTPTAEDLTVFYMPDASEWQGACTDMTAAGFDSVTSFNPYWNARGRPFADADGYRVVLQHAAWAHVAAGH